MNIFKKNLKFKENYRGKLGTFPDNYRTLSGEFSNRSPDSSCFRHAKTIFEEISGGLKIEFELKLPFSVNCQLLWYFYGSKIFIYRKIGVVCKKIPQQIENFRWVLGNFRYAAHRCIEESGVLLPNFKENYRGKFRKFSRTSSEIFTNTLEKKFKIFSKIIGNLK